MAHARHRPIKAPVDKKTRTIKVILNEYLEYNVLLEHDPDWQDPHALPSGAGETATAPTEAALKQHAHPV